MAKQKVSKKCGKAWPNVEPMTWAIGVFKCGKPVIKMAIGPMVMAACGQPTRMGRVCAVLFPHGLYPWVTRLVVGRAGLRVCARGLPMGHPINTSA